MNRGLRILVGAAAASYIAALCVVVYTLSEQQSADTRITRAEKFDPCVSLSEAVANKAADRIKPLTRECREFLNGIGPLVTIKLSCAIIEKARYVCPAPGTAPAQGRHQSGVPLGPTLSAAPGPHSGPEGSNDGSGGVRTGPDNGPSIGGHKPPKAPPAPPSSPVIPPAENSSPDTPLPSPQPGNSGSGASAEHGLDVCVELAVSACVKSGLDVPLQLP